MWPWVPESGRTRSTAPARLRTSVAAACEFLGDGKFLDQVLLGLLVQDWKPASKAYL